MITKGKDGAPDELVLRFEKEEFNFSGFSKDQFREMIKFIKNYQVGEYIKGSVEGGKAIEKILVSLAKLIGMVGKND